MFVFEKVGVDIFNMGIGWYEVCVLIIVSMVLLGVFKEVLKCLKDIVLVLVIVVNCINIFEIVNGILEVGEFDLILMVCFLLVDFEFFNKYVNNKLE